MEKALRVHFDIGTEIAGQVKGILAIEPNDARSLSRVIDFLHDAFSFPVRKSFVVHKVKLFHIGTNVHCQVVF